MCIDLAVSKRLVSPSPSLGLKKNVIGLPFQAELSESKSNSISFRHTCMVSGFLAKKLALISFFFNL